MTDTSYLLKYFEKKSADNPVKDQKAQTKRVVNKKLSERKEGERYGS